MAEEQTSFTKRKWATSGRPPPHGGSVSPPEEVSGPSSGQTSALGVQDALRHAEGRCRALLGIVSDLLFHIRKDGVVLAFQGPKESEYALSAENLVGKRIVELLPTQIGLQAMYHVEKALRTGGVETYACPYQLPGRVRDFEARIAPCAPGEVLALVRDVTQRRQMEKEILDISNRTQARIGQDLHDGLGQHLTGITFLCKALERKLSEQSLAEASEAAEIGRMVMQALAQTRHLARGLFPVDLESGGLVPALRELAAAAENMCEIACELECDENLAVPDRSTATHLFRIAQEALNNAVKHGKAKRVVIRLHALGDRAVLSIRDDGVGFNAEEVKAQGLGLRIMNYRAQKIGGTLVIQPGDTGGTVISCVFHASAEEL